MIKSKKIIFRPLEVQDTDEFYNWACDREVNLYSLSSYAYPQSKSDITKWLLSINENKSSVNFGLVCATSNKLIGYAGLTSINLLSSSGEYFILIGNKEYWSKGIGLEITKLITNYGIKTLRLNRIELTAYSPNKAAIRVYEKAGYVHEGVMRQAGFRNGEFIDKVQMSILASEWNGL